MPCFDLGDSKMRGRGLSFFKECCFRIRVSVNAKTVFFKKKKIGPDPAFYWQPFDFLVLPKVGVRRECVITLWIIGIMK